MKALILTLAALSMAACAQRVQFRPIQGPSCKIESKFLVCPDGSSIALPEDGKPGQDGATVQATELVLEASRSYNPSDWNNKTVAAEPGVYLFPETLELVSGAAGTGWASIVLEDSTLCYQGNGLNNGQAGTEFVFSRIVAKGSSCYSNPVIISTSLSKALLSSGELITLSFNGGGVNNTLIQLADLHTVKAVIKADIITNN